MPLRSYDYACKKCSKVIDMLVDNDKRDEQTCETCGGKLERMLTTSGLYSISGDNSGSVRPKGLVKPRGGDKK